MDELRRAPIALVPAKPNEQHYEVPPEFFRARARARTSSTAAATGPGRRDARRGRGGDARAHVRARPELADGQAILDLGCGWGSLSLWIAERFPEARITAVSNSRRSASSSSARRGARLSNVEVVTADVSELELDRALRPRRLDRDVRAHAQLRGAAAADRGLAASRTGTLFVHVFCHRRARLPVRRRGRATGWRGSSSPAG